MCSLRSGLCNGPGREGPHALARLGNGGQVATGVLMANGREISFRCCAIITPRSEANVSVWPHHPEPANAVRGLTGLG